MFKYLKISSPGKIILCGEHSVVYGKKALACSINLRTSLKAEYSDTNKPIFRLNLNDLNRSIEINEDLFRSIRNESVNDLDKIIENLENSSFEIKDKHLDSVKFLFLSLDTLQWEHLSGIILDINSEIPLASGLGSSASFSVCLATFFLIISSKINLNFNQEDLNLINKFSFYIEKLFHGKPSGIDNSVSTFGNFILYEKGLIVDKFNSNLDLNVLITNSCVPKQTLEQVKKVRNLYEKHQNILDHLMASIDSIVEKFVVLLKQGDLDSENNSETLNDLITLNQGLLFSLQVTNTELNTIINIAAKYKLHSKITGAGGGGCCITLLNNDKNLSDFTINETLINELKENNFLPFLTKLGCNGVLIEEFLN